MVLKLHVKQNILSRYKWAITIGFATTQHKEREQKKLMARVKYSSNKDKDEN